MHTYAFLDITNVHITLKNQSADPWEVDWERFRIFLSDKYRVEKAYCFLWYNPKHVSIYTRLVKSGFELVHKPMIPTEKWLYKGNCDAEMVLYAVDLQNEYDKAILVTGDGDFWCLAKYLIEKTSSVDFSRRAKKKRHTSSVSYDQTILWLWQIYEIK